eukprot:scaffold1953_cov76-Skeletonema_dohrnii-CCMP3373.AAC.1
MLLESPSNGILTNLIPPPTHMFINEGSSARLHHITWETYHPEWTRVTILMNDHKKEKLLLMSLIFKTVIIHVAEIGLIDAFNCVMMICEHFVW